MRLIVAIILVFVFAFSFVPGVHAQVSETIWLTANTTAYKTGETVLITVNAMSVTPIQGFTFQVRYDPACLKPVNATSPIPGMNGLSLPQTSGLVDASFASTTPQIVNGVLAELRFVTLGGCQTGINLENAALAVRNEKGFAAPLPGVKFSQSSIALNVDSAVGEQSDQPVSGTPLPLDPTIGSPSNFQSPLWGVAAITIFLILGLGFGIYKVIQKTAGMAYVDQPSPSFLKPVAVSFKMGSRAGKRFSLNRLPCVIGHDPSNDICLDDPQVIGQHIKIYAANNDYYLMDLGGETFVNGRAVRKSSAVLKSGDVVRLGRRVLFVFGT
ncbi:MAG: FHA domain-containing protein [Anaerolineales bacterium]|nr:FHA domain-containing protein [Anaerolineales bacterium]